MTVPFTAFAATTLLVGDEHCYARMVKQHSAKAWTLLRPDSCCSIEKPIEAQLQNWHKVSRNLQLLRQLLRACGAPPPLARPFCCRRICAPGALHPSFAFGSTLSHPFMPVWFVQAPSTRRLPHFMRPELWNCASPLAMLLPQ